MNKRELSFLIKKSSPALYRVAYSLYFHLGGFLDSPRYFYCRAANRPYFGPVLLSGLTCRSRDTHMRRIIQMLIDKKTNDGRGEELRVLEIGSWAGQSAILWGKEIVRSNYPGKVYCVDAWMPFSKRSEVGINNATQMMDNVAQRDKIFPLFWHNVKSSGLSNIVLPLRSKSNDILPQLKPESFDLVFVDGSHTYSQFLSDLTLAAPLVKQSGIICGDDLELQSSEIDLYVAEQNKEKDFVTDPKTQRDYHPGVCLGVSQYFNRSVSVYDGFWVAKKDSAHWIDVKLY